MIRSKSSSEDGSQGPAVPCVKGTGSSVKLEQIVVQGAVQEVAVCHGAILNRLGCRLVGAKGPLPDVPTLSSAVVRGARMREAIRGSRAAGRCEATKQCATSRAICRIRYLKLRAFRHRNTRSFLLDSGKLALVCSVMLDDAPTRELMPRLWIGRLRALRI